jgi:hypothetical protein
MRFDRRDYAWLVAAVCLVMATAAVAYRCGHRHACLDAESEDFHPRLDSIGEEASWQSPQALRAAYNLGVLDGMASERRQAAGQPAETASCLACHANRMDQPQGTSQRDPLRNLIRFAEDKRILPAVYVVDEYEP